MTPSAFGSAWIQHLDDVARLLDLCQELDLRVLFGFATFYVNDQFIEDFPDARIIDRQGQAYPLDRHDYRWQRGCIDHPAYPPTPRRAAGRCARDALARIQRFLTGMCITSRVSARVTIPATAPIRSRGISGTSPRAMDQSPRSTSVGVPCYGTFDDVVPPTEIDATPAGPWRDWREFLARNLSAFLLEGVQILKEQIPGGRASFNVTYPFNIQGSGQDWWTVPEPRLCLGQPLPRFGATNRGQCRHAHRAAESACT